LAPAPGAGGVDRLAALAATCGVELSGIEPSAGGEGVARIRRVGRRLRANGLAPEAAEPVVECAVLYSAEADLWTQGRHRIAVERAVECLAALHVQAAVVTQVARAPAGAALALADAAALSPAEAKEVRRRLEAGAPVLAFGEPGAVDEAGRPGAAFLPAAKASGTKVGEGTLVGLPPLVPERGGALPAGLVDKAAAAVLGKGRRAAGVVSRVPIVVALHRTDGTLLVHLVGPDDEPARGTTLFLGVHVAGGARRARFVSAEGADVRIPLNPSGYSLSTVLPAFRGYAVLSLAP
ncbi:MAG TPA: hypothetical protein VF841_18460, partial [Anaeromyxobacter sp.]